MASTVNSTLTVHRIGAARFIGDRSGAGARLAGGRWNDKGLAVLYTSQSISLACLEVLVHYGKRSLAGTFRQMAVTIPKGVSIKEIPLRRLGRGWTAFPESRECRDIGNTWIEQDRYCVLKVPSVVVHQEHNYLLNPAHKEFKRIRFGKPQRMVFDGRIYK